MRGFQPFKRHKTILGLSEAKDSIEGLKNVDELRNAIRRVLRQMSMCLREDSFDLGNDDDTLLWLHVVGIHAFKLRLYGKR